MRELDPPLVRLLEKPQDRSKPSWLQDFIKRIIEIIKAVFRDLEL